VRQNAAQKIIHGLEGQGPILFRPQRRHSDHPGSTSGRNVSWFAAGSDAHEHAGINVADPNRSGEPFSAAGFGADF
jgi:hypothetical protein